MQQFNGGRRQRFSSRAKRMLTNMDLVPADQRGQVAMGIMADSSVPFSKLMPIGRVAAGPIKEPDNKV